jgi:hypothetical protein
MLRVIFLVLVSLVLASCHGNPAPSPQDTTPSKKAMCADLRNKIMMSAAADSESAVAISAAEHQDFQEAYKNQCP